MLSEDRQNPYYIVRIFPPVKVPLPFLSLSLCHYWILQDMTLVRKWWENAVALSLPITLWLLAYKCTQLSVSLIYYKIMRSKSLVQRCGSRITCWTSWKRIQNNGWSEEPLLREQWLVMSQVKHKALTREVWHLLDILAKMTNFFS